MDRVPFLFVCLIFVPRPITILFVCLLLSIVTARMSSFRIPPPTRNKRTAAALATGENDAAGVVCQRAHEQHAADAKAKASLLNGPGHGQNRAAHHGVPHAENGDERALFAGRPFTQHKQVQRQDVLGDDLGEEREVEQMREMRER